MPLVGPVVNIIALYKELYYTFLTSNHTGVVFGLSSAGEEKQVKVNLL